jgi:hypothetical protein
MASELRGLWGDERRDDIFYGHGTITASGITGWTRKKVAGEYRLWYDAGHGWCDFTWVGNKIYAFWVMRPYAGYRLRFSMSEDGGITWSPVQTIYDTMYYYPDVYTLYAPRVAANSLGRVFCSFIVGGGSGPAKLKLVYSDDDFASHSLVTIYTYPSASTPYSSALIVDSDDNVHAAYKGDGGSLTTMHHRKSANGGVTFGSEHLISGTLDTLWYLDMVEDQNGDLHVISSYDDVAVGTYVVGHWDSPDDGDSWNYTGYLSTIRSSGFNTMRLAAYGDELYAWWGEYAVWPAQERLYYSHSPDLGTNWDAPVVPNGSQPYIENVSYNGGGYAPDAGVTVFGYITEDRDPGTPHVGAILSTDGLAFTFQELSTTCFGFSGYRGKCSFKVEAVAPRQVSFWLG